MVKITRASRSGFPSALAAGWIVLVFAIAVPWGGMRVLADDGLINLRSPNGDVQIRVSSAPNGNLKHTVKFRGRTVVRPSELRFSLDGRELTREVECLRTERGQQSQTYPWRGVHSRATNRCHTATAALRSRPLGIAYSMECRAFDDGVAFRYVVPGGAADRVPDENDSFILPEGSTVWYHGERGHYEDTYQRKKLEEIEAGDWAMPPVTFKLPGRPLYACITEAALVHFSGMALQANGSNGFNLVLAHNQPASYPYRLRYATNDVERLSRPAAIRGTIVSPWRVVMIGRNLDTLVNSDLIHNLCPPPDPDLFPEGLNTSWLKPGRAVWKYLDGGESTLQGARDFCRLAGQLGFEYNILEGYWSRWSETDIRELVAYGRQQGVGLWFWKHSRGLRTPDDQEAFFRKMQELGVVGAKIDFFDHEHKEVIDVYHELLRQAARHRIMVNFHGSNKPTGESRTWPNEMTREAVKGMEASKLADRATHDATLPFTRYLAGHGDYTVMHFGARRGNTTWAHQIATAAVFNQPLNTIAAHPATILTNPAVELIRSIPAAWDETRVLPPSEIGEVAVFARRTGRTWFLAVINGEGARTFRVPLSFLSSGEHRALLVGDPEREAAALRVTGNVVGRRHAITVKLAPGGGFIARFVPTSLLKAPVP